MHVLSKCVRALLSPQRGGYDNSARCSRTSSLRRAYKVVHGASAGFSNLQYLSVRTTESTSIGAPSRHRQEAICLAFWRWRGRGISIAGSTNSPEYQA